MYDISPDTESLIPPYSSELERAVAELATRLDTLPVQHAQLWDPFQCPEDFLPWLAHALSVDIWDDDWPLQAKRKVIAEAVPTHRVKGTVAAVKSALSALVAKVELKEWWQLASKDKQVPHSFELLALAHENLDAKGTTLLTPKLQAQLWQLVVATKPLRSQFTLSLGVQQSAEVLLSSTALSVNVQAGVWQQHTQDSFSLSHSVCQGAAKTQLLEKRALAASPVPNLNTAFFISGSPSLCVVQSTSMTFT